MYSTTVMGLILGFGVSYGWEWLLHTLLIIILFAIPFVAFQVWCIVHTVKWVIDKPHKKWAAIIGLLFIIAHIIRGVLMAILL
jgi:hypothetical protein